jgi:hypothetical protein
LEVLGLYPLALPPLIIRRILIVVANTSIGEADTKSESTSRVEVRAKFFREEQVIF